MRDDIKKPKLAAVMIVKNEEQSLGGILSDIRDVVDEICIVDTGSTDGTVALAKSFGAKIGHFPWVGDFAVARNHSIELADADYLLWLDADDRIDEQEGKALVSLKSRLRPEKDTAYMLKILGCSEDMPETISFQTRVIPNCKELRFEGRVHEQILPALEASGVRIESTDITIRHTGYHDEQARMAKARRNLDILKEELKEGKDTATQCFFLAMAAIGIQDYEQCLSYLSKARQKRTHEDWLHFSYTVSTDCLLRLGRIAQAGDEIARGIGLYPESPLLHYYHGRVCMQAEQYREAAAAFEKAASLPPRIDTYPCPPDLAATILFQHGQALEKTGDMEAAVAVYTRALTSWSRNKSLHLALGMALLKLDRVSEALDRLEQARALLAEFDPGLWLTLAKVHLFLGHHAEAHALHHEIFAKNQADRDAATSLIQTSVPMDDVENLLAALEALMTGLGMDTDRELAAPADIARLCADVGRKLYDQKDSHLAARLAEAALAIDPGCAESHLLLFDLLIAQGQRADAIKRLEQATHAGAPLAVIEKRLALLESS